ncbi:hypothetical protein HSR121_2290 [Halapricum desulfuricans]|uniref:Uncharacterized protein n=1 Tax=Halapricum desulfuricans TaxID=2841257 RepID=A0A897N317_9EURY|nr:hypothetical protein HSR121_2290 [Halapricum desulfuricans]
MATHDVPFDLSTTRLTVAAADSSSPVVCDPTRVSKSVTCDRVIL